MDNVDIRVKGNIMTIAVDLTRTIGPSKSGKTVMVATTNGNAAHESGVTIGLNIYRKAPAAKAAT